MVDGFDGDLAAVLAHLPAPVFFAFCFWGPWFWRRGGGRCVHEDDARDMLRKLLARGVIDEADYRRMKDLISGLLFGPRRSLRHCCARAGWRKPGAARILEESGWRRMQAHWLLRLHLAERIGPGAITLLDGMNASWHGSNWRFTPAGVLLLFGVGVATGLASGVVGRWIVVHL